MLYFNSTNGYISYSSIDEILKEKRLSYMTDDILKEFEEWSQE